VWLNVVNEVPTGHFGVKRYQGVGKTTREAKINACTEALQHLRSFVPGVAFEPGHVPLEWLEWVDTSLLKGTPASRIVSILATKGFQPHRNLALMQKVSLWHQYQLFQQAHKHLAISVDGVGTRLLVFFLILTLWLRSSSAYSCLMDTLSDTDGH
jgi:hypothetical protein